MAPKKKLRLLCLLEEHFESLQTAARNVQNVYSFHRNTKESARETSGANWSQNEEEMEKKNEAKYDFVEARQNQNGVIFFSNIKMPQKSPEYS